MGLKLEYSEGQTPIDEEEKLGLKIPVISTKKELDEFEQKNIEDALMWTLNNSWKSTDVFDTDFLKKVHKQMFNQVWSWAGLYRNTNKNIGVDYWMIASKTQQLIDDLIYWYDFDVYYDVELAIRFKHRLVSIHCFSNGNGRHSRLMADIIISHIFKQSVFSWGSGLMLSPLEIRARYLTALKQADDGDYGPLIAFANA